MTCWWMDPTFSRELGDSVRSFHVSVTTPPRIRNVYRGTTPLDGVCVVSEREVQCFIQFRVHGEFARVCLPHLCMYEGVWQIAAVLQHASNKTKVK